MGIDYGLGQTNVSDTTIAGNATRIRYGVIPAHAVPYYYEESEPWYGKPHCPACGAQLDDDVDDGHECECGHTIKWVGEECYSDEVISSDVVNDDYHAQCGQDGDIFITKSPYYTVCEYCSPCAPGAGYILNEADDCAAFCFGPDWFDGKPPYAIYRVSDGQMIYHPEA